jgi:hypothetical protein
VAGYTKAPRQAPKNIPSSRPVVPSRVVLSFYPTLCIIHLKPEPSMVAQAFYNATHPHIEVTNGTNDSMQITVKYNPTCGHFTFDVKKNQETEWCTKEILLWYVGEWFDKRETAQILKKLYIKNKIIPNCPHCFATAALSTS